MPTNPELVKMAELISTAEGYDYKQGEIWKTASRLKSHFAKSF